MGGALPASTREPPSPPHVPQTCAWSSSSQKLWYAAPQDEPLSVAPHPSVPPWFGAHSIGPHRLLTYFIFGMKVAPSSSDSPTTKPLEMSEQAHSS
jgi:hypothetical protein